MNKIWFFQTFLTSIFIRLHMKANLCKTFGNWQLAQTFSFMCHWYFCVKSEPLFTAARTQQANFTWPDKITLTSSHFKRPGSKICLQNPTLWHFTIYVIIIPLWECWTHWTMWKGEKHFCSQSAAVRRLSSSILAWGQDNPPRACCGSTCCILTGSKWGKKVHSAQLITWACNGWESWLQNISFYIIIWTHWI